MMSLRKCILLLLALIVTTNLFSQILGPELLSGGSFGTIATVGKNGDNPNNSVSLYNKAPDDIPIYYQPATIGYYGWNIDSPLSNVEEYTNPHVTIAPPLVNIENFEYGMSVIDYSFPLYFADLNGKRSNSQIPHAPNSGQYLIATSTAGMYNMGKVSNSVTWYLMYDKYETDTIFPSNYFLIVAETTSIEIFYENSMRLKSGQLYRVAADLCRLNTNLGAPDVAILVKTENDSDYTQIGATGDITVGGEWLNLYVDYMVPLISGQDSVTVNVAFKNLKPEYTGNDVAFDNFSLKEIIPYITVNIDDCNTATLSLVSSTNNYSITSYQWQELSGTDFVNIDNATGNNYSTGAAGTYRLIVQYTDNLGQSGEIISNEITVSTLNNCLAINSPLAVDDHYHAYAEIPITRDIFDNDSDSNGDQATSDNVQVIYYEVNGTQYSAGETAVLYDADNERAGIVTIHPDGTLEFSAVTHFRGTFPTVTYTIAENEGGTSSANITFELLLDYNASIEASCTSCPIVITITNETQLDTNVSLYNVRRKDNTETITDLTVEYDAGADAMILTFYDSNSGLNYYTLQYNNPDGEQEDIATISVFVHPQQTHWAPVSRSNSDYSNNGNWISEHGIGKPIWCTDITILSNSLFYPVVAENDSCRDITFKEGTAIGQIHKLYYRKANIEFTPSQADEFIMLAAPLKYMYSADYHADTTWGAFAGIQPKIYLRNFNTMTDNSQGITIGDFSEAIPALDFPFTSTMGFVLNVGEGENFPNRTYVFPRRNTDGSDVTYFFHYTDNGEWILNNPNYPPFYPPRGADEATISDDDLWFNEHINGGGNYNPWAFDSRYRFIYESGSAPTSSFTMQVEPSDASNLVAIGNSMMSYIDFDAFYASNSDKIQNYFWILEGSNYVQYGVGDLIAPMQAFIVELTTNGQQNIIFNLDDILTLPPSPGTGGLSASKKNTLKAKDNKLRIKLTMGEKENTAMIEMREDASDEYIPGEDIYKLFSDETSIRKINNEKFYPIEVYTIASQKAMSTNVISSDGDEKIIPIGIKTMQTGDALLELDGLEVFDSFESLYIVDTQENKEYNLRENNKVYFTKTSEDLLAGRFYLVMKNEGMTSENNDISTDEILYFSDNGVITISTPDSEIQGIELFDVSGNLIYQENNIFSKLKSIAPPLGKGIYLIQVITKNNTHTIKLSI